MPGADVGLMLSSLIQLSHMEHVLCDPKAGELHMNAIGDLFETQGGFSAFWFKNGDSNTTLEPIFYASQYINFDNKVASSLPDIEQQHYEFITSLRQIEEKTLALQAEARRTQHNYAEYLAVNKLELQQFVDYLNELLQSNSSSEILDEEFFLSSFFLIYFICEVVTVGNFDARQTTDFLSRAQHYLCLSAMIQMEESVIRLQIKPKTAAKVINHVRWTDMKMGSPSEDIAQNVEICDAMIRALRVFRTMDAVRQRELMINLVKCLLVLTDTVENRMDLSTLP